MPFLTVSMSRIHGQTLFNCYRTLCVHRKLSDNASMQKNPPHLEETKLMKQIKAKILTTGPITVADYMKEVLTNPSAGYYMNRDVFGQKGDFITSPEISQVFGELVGIWFVNEWEKCGRPKPLQITELGPGRGTLMHDILRVFSKFNIVEAADLSINFVEISPHLSKVQQMKLCKTLDGAQEYALENANHYKEARTVFGPTVRWYRHLSETPKSFTLYLAHEFFDALPVHKLVKKENEWREVLIDLGPTQSELRYVLSRSRTPACLFPKENEQRTELEVSPQSLVMVQHMAQRIHEDGGVGLVIDYGHEGEKTDTFRAFRDHKLHDPLVEPGTADLTADVDFSALKWAATNPSTGAEWKANLTYGTVTQRDFLINMGIEVRLQTLLAACKNENVAKDLQTAHKMLLDPQEMGGKFRFLALFPAVMERILQRYPPFGFS